jgi:thiol-disulfide isomerase/thioredoxin
MKLLKKVEDMFKGKHAMRNTFIVIAGILVIVYLVNHFNKVQEGLDNGGKDKECVFFHMNGCPHCVDMMPEWDNFVKKNNTDANSTVSTRKIEKDDDSSNLGSKLGVSGYPTVYLIDKSTQSPIAEYKGERTSSGLMDFIKQHT